MTGVEYVSAETLAGAWRELELAFAAARAAAGGTLQDFLRALDPQWNLVGRVYFNLAENRRDEETPFAFVATYTAGLSKQAKAHHLKLGSALLEYAGDANHARMLSLLQPVQRAAERCEWLRELVDDGAIFHTLRWTPAEALRMLADVPTLEQAGVMVRMPPTWRAGRPSRPQVTATVGAKPPGGVGQDALLDFKVELTLDGEPLAADEVERLLASTDGLALLRGRWIELDRAKLEATLRHLQAVERRAAAGGLSFGEAMRLVSGVDVGAPAPTGTTAAAATAIDPMWTGVVAGPWLGELLRELRAPDADGGGALPGDELRATLRPYQQAGVRWLHLLSSLGLGACLADDMGLGKTIQVIALLLVRRREARRAKARRASASLLVAPASLLGNWVGELERFAPDLRVKVIHPSALQGTALGEIGAADLDVDLVITTYGTLHRAPALSQASWDLLIVDEAQAIKNPGARQTRAVKQLTARARIALTGTPVENRLGDLWSIFDFVNPGLLGSAKQFTTYTKKLAERTHNPYGPLRELVRPYLLRRLKTDRTVIADLPDKTEVKALCGLTRAQAALYQRAVEELAEALARGKASGIQRKGLVLAYIMRFKQICNHPSQWLGDGGWAEDGSGKLARLRELVEVIASRQEKALIFTQFREVTAPLAAFLGGVFGRPGLVLHGSTAVGARKELVRRFQDDESIPFFVLSLKAGGTGLNLTAASHVIHFDRWWNPAVEDQATDRAFRIGQKKNVLVHKLVCRGTVEERIDGMIERKQKLSRELLVGGAELDLTSLPDAELLRLVALDHRAALED
jgi:non-specific serine/threonine protein kinase